MCVQRSNRFSRRASHANKRGCVDPVAVCSMRRMQPRRIGLCIQGRTDCTTDFLYDGLLVRRTSSPSLPICADGLEVRRTRLLSRRTRLLSRRTRPSAVPPHSSAVPAVPDWTETDHPVRLCRRNLYRAIEPSPSPQASCGAVRNLLTTESARTRIERSAGLFFSWVQTARNLGPLPNAHDLWGCDTL